MNVVDSSGWLEYLADGPNAGFFAAALQDTGRLIVPTLSILEVFKRVLQQRGEDAALQAASAMRQGESGRSDFKDRAGSRQTGLQKRVRLETGQA